MRKPVLIAALGVLLLAGVVCAWAGEPLAKAYRLMAHGEYTQALAELDAVLAGVPDNPFDTTPEQKELLAETFFLFGRANEELGDRDAALGAYHVVTGSFKGTECYARACLALAQLHIRQGESKKATAELQKALDRGLSPEHEFYANLYLAEALMLPGSGAHDVDKAIRLLGKLDETAHAHADIARINYDLGYCYQQKDDWKQAEQHYTAVSQTSPASLWSFCARVQRLAYYRQKRLDQDVALIQAQLRQQKVDLEHLIEAGPFVHRMLDEFALSIRQQENKALEMKLPDNAIFSYNGYTVKADEFRMRRADRTLIGRKNVVLEHQGAGGEKTQVRASTVSIDLRRRDAAFTGSVVYEILPKDPDGQPKKREEYSGLIINLDTGWLRVRFSESHH